MAIRIMDADLRFNDNHSDREGDPKGIVLHHAAIDGAVEDIHRYHRDVNGWAGIGYHFYVTKDGVIWRGRPEAWLGAHTTGFNDRIGICAEGNFEEETMPAAQQRAIVQLIAYLEGKYGKPEITRHCDHDATACPGEKYPFEDIVAAVRGREAERADKLPQSATSTAPSKREPENKVLRFQRAAMADGLELPVYEDDGIWGAETAGAAGVLLMRSAAGERVRLAQKLLMALGYDLGTAGADGIFGKKTDEAVRAFQGKHELGVDGIIGLQTWKALLGVTA